jgi:glycosyltransferase involved in cell wall biosynthesis
VRSLSPRRKQGRAQIALGSPRPGRTTSDPRSVLFIRDFRQFSGGHLKTWHYFEHVRQHPRFTPVVQFTDQSVWDDSNPWINNRDEAISEHDRYPADVVFLGGLTWLLLPERQRDDSPVPIINIIQGVRHAEEPRLGCLRHRAVRVCVGPEVAEAISATGMCNGPVITIPNGIDVASLPEPIAGQERQFDLLIAGKKSPAAARTLGERLARPGRRVRVLDGLVSRTEFLDAMNQARVVVFLPKPAEGFFLPALEAMTLRSVVVCPDVVGNRSFCIDGVTCFRPAYDDEAIVAATETALAQTEEERERMLSAASETAGGYDLESERKAFFEVLDHLDDLYQNG